MRAAASSVLALDGDHIDRDDLVFAVESSGPECTVDADCDDGAFCNGAEVCPAPSTPATRAPTGTASQAESAARARSRPGVLPWPTDSTSPAAVIRERMGGGAIECHDREGGGAIFEVRLPSPEKE